jgi:hypothetical protein
MTYDNSNPNSRPMPPAPAKPDRIISPTTWVLGTITILVALAIGGLALVETSDTKVSSTPDTTTGVAPATPASPSKDANKTDSK